MYVRTSILVVIAVLWPAALSHGNYDGMRPPPGVPPQQYADQQQQQYQQHNVPQQPQYNVPHQQHQPPQQQGYQQPQHVQQPVHSSAHGGQQHGVPQGGHHGAAQGGHHAAHGGHHQGNLLDASHISQEKDHIREHMDVPLDTSKMTEQELQFHYFKMHDSDNNNMLDGSELVKSLIHFHDGANHDPNSGMPVPEEKIFADEELVAMIDPILANDDKNSDGFIDYPEFMQAQQAAMAKAQAEASTQTTRRR